MPGRSVFSLPNLAKVSKPKESKSNYNASKFVNNHPIKIKLLKAKYTKNYYKSGLFREFRNAKFKSIEVENHTSRNNAIFEDLREIKTDVLRIWTNAASEESILELRPLKRFDCCEDASLDDDRFQKFCEKLKNESMLESAYSCILYSRNFLPNGFLTEMLNEFGGEEKYLNGRKCVTAPTVNPDHELNICCDNKVYIGELPRNQLTVRVMKKGSSKKREETNVLNRARFNARSIFIRLLSLLLIALKNHLVRHNSLVHARFILIPMMMFTATNIESVIELLILVAATWFTWEAFMGFYQLMLYPPVTRLCYRIPNQRIARVVWALAISPVFFTTALAWGLSMFIIQTGLYTFHRYRDMYLRDYVYDD
uniref:Uncharacterized protein n=1 Tax=Caenorhabditis japonica TaxID=281687 RepID=A0A8R1E196_CAEJA